MSARLNCLETIAMHGRNIRERLDVAEFDVPELVPIIPFTYSSVLVDGEAVPSRFSMMSAHAAEFLRAVLVSDVSCDRFAHPLHIAGETSHPGHPDTGELLAKQVLSDATRVTLVPAENITALLNTSGQVRVHAKYMRDKSFIDPVVVCLGFHQKRIARHFEAQDMRATLISIENIFMWAQHFMGEDQLKELKQMYGFRNDPLSTLCAVLPEYARREKLVRLAAVPRNGVVVDALTAARRCGRQDDIDTKGQLVMGRASTHSRSRLSIFKSLRVI